MGSAAGPLFCPIPVRLRARLASGTYAVTALGLERWCYGCRDYWPADTEFWPPCKRDGLHTWCRACNNEYRAAWRRRRRGAGESNTEAAA